MRQNPTLLSFPPLAGVCREHFLKIRSSQFRLSGGKVGPAQSFIGEAIEDGIFLSLQGEHPDGTLCLQSGRAGESCTLCREDGQINENNFSIAVPHSPYGSFKVLKTFSNLTSCLSASNSGVTFVQRRKPSSCFMAVLSHWKALSLSPVAV